MTAKKSTKTGKNFREGGGKNFSGWPEYIPLEPIETRLDICRPTIADEGDSRYILVVKIDHMRNHTAYTKTLRRWAEGLNLR